LNKWFGEMVIPDVYRTQGYRDIHFSNLKLLLGKALST
jgi:hypothetical protein